MMILMKTMTTTIRRRSYVEVDEEDDVEAAFAGRFVQRSYSFDNKDEDDDIDDV
jgi:hypothetical protein